MSELPFDKYKELIQIPLEQSDPRSFNQVKRLFLEVNYNQPNPFGFLIGRLTGKLFSSRDAMNHWRHILENKQALQIKLGRTIGIQTAAIDYFEQQSAPETFYKTGDTPEEAQSTASDWIERVYTPGYHLEKLKEEILRAKRYKHALSAIMLDIDEFHKINDDLTHKVGDKILTLIVKIIKKTIRTVDILTRYSGDRFMLILPNTNKREAMELAERIRHNVFERTKRIEELPAGVTITLSVGQCAKEDTSNDFLRRLESTLEEGKRKGRNAVYAL